MAQAAFKNAGFRKGEIHVLNKLQFGEETPTTEAHTSTGMAKRKE